MAELAILGGTGLSALGNMKTLRREVMHTPYGETSGALTFGKVADKEVVFLPRHGYGHTIPPHMVNYRANLWALKNKGVTQVISVCAVGGIAANMKPGSIIIPDQIIDYTWSRHHTFFEQDLKHVTHIDFTEPYSKQMRDYLIAGAAAAGVVIIAGGTYGATQGPRLETAAEIDRMERDGCDIVGMTGMPETALARELDLDYAACAVCANLAAGRGEGAILMDEIDHNLSAGMQLVTRILEHAIPEVC